MSSILNTCTLGDANCYDPPKGGRPTNIFTMHSGASRPGTGRFLMLKTDFEGLGETETLVMKGPPGPGISLQVVILGAVPYETGPDKDSATLGGTMVEVIVNDIRVQLTTPLVSASSATNTSFNVQQQGFPYSNSTTPQFYTTTINGSTAWQWTEVMSQLQMNPAFPQNIDIPDPQPMWMPRNLIYDGTATSKIIDDIAEQLYIVCGFDYTQTLFEGIDYYPPGSSTDSSGSDSGNTAIFSNCKNYLLAGADPNNPVGGSSFIGTDSWLRCKTRFPNLLRIMFKIYNKDNPNNPYPTGTYQRVYTKDTTVSGGSSNANYILPITYGSYIALLSNGAIYNQTELDTVATDIGTRALKAMQVPLGEKMFGGIWPFVPDGMVRGIQWVNNRSGATTRIRINNDNAFNPFDETKRAVDSISNQAIVGLGVDNAMATPSGSRLFWSTGSNSVPISFSAPLSEPGAYNGFIIPTGYASIASAIPGGSSSSSSSGISTPCIIINIPDINAVDASNDPIWPVPSGHSAIGIIVGTSATGDTPSSTTIVWCETYISDYINCGSTSSSSSS